MGSDYEIAKKIRKEKKISLRRLAELSGLSASFISNFENGKVNITLSSLKKIAAALEVPVARLVADEEESPLMVVRKNERFNIVHHKSAEGTVIQQFLTRSPHFDMEVVVLELPPGTSSENYKAHPGQEFTFVLKGTVRLMLNDNCSCLSGGDMAYYDATIPHRWENAGLEDAEILVGATPASF